MTFTLKAGDRQIDLSTPVCMGILNVTPDSFSDGSELGEGLGSGFEVDVDKALFRADSMLGDGATFIDIGGESTRPGAAKVSISEEMGRVMPVIEAIRAGRRMVHTVSSTMPAISTPGSSRLISASR